MQRSTPSRLVSLLVLGPLLAAGLVLTGCDSNGSMDGGGNDGSDNIEVPSSYAFDSRFVDGESAVAYPGQVTRNLLMADLKTLTDGRGSSVPSKSDLMDRYEYDSQDLNILLSTDPAPNHDQYNEIATGKSLSGKATAPYSDEALIGIGEVSKGEGDGSTFSGDATADDVIREYFDQIAQNYANGQEAPNAYTTDEGVDMSQFTNKLILGAVAYSQGTDKYLDDVLNTSDSPNSQDGDNPYSTLGHTFDEGFGYFGAPREFNAFFDDSGIDGALDRNGDGEIDLESEYTYTWADYAYDRGSVGGDFHTEAFNAFLKGRTAIVNEAAESEIRSHAADAREAWEKVVAANVVHYLNSMESDVEAGISDSEIDERNNTDFNAHWAEAKLFVWTLQYNPTGVATSDALDLQSLHTTLGTAPPYDEYDQNGASGVKNNVTGPAKKAIQDAFEDPAFDEALSDW